MNTLQVSDITDYNSLHTSAYKLMHKVRKISGNWTSLAAQTRSNVHQECSPKSRQRQSDARRIFAARDSQSCATFDMDLK